MRRLWAFLMLVLPAPLHAELGRRVFGWDIDPTAYIGRSLILVQHVSMGPETSIGSLNVIRNLEELRLAKGASIATRNFISAHPMAALAFKTKNRRACLIMGEWSKITVGHEIDCSDTVEIGDHAGLIGYRCQILTHSLDLIRDEQVTGPVKIGPNSGVMSGCILLSGTRVPARCIISAGSVVATKLTKEQTFYRGNPAQPVRELPDLPAFHRGDAEARRYTM